MATYLGVSGKTVIKVSRRAGFPALVAGMRKYFSQDIILFLRGGRD